MRPDQLEALRAVKAKQEEHLQQLLDTPEDRRPPGPKARAWARELDASRRAIEDLGRTIQGGIRAVQRQAAPPSQGPQETLLLATIPKGRTAEIRVALKGWRVGQTIDVRCYELGGAAGVMRPTRKAFQVDARNLPALIEALTLAQHHIESGSDGT